MSQNEKQASSNFDTHYRIKDINEVFYEKFKTKEDVELIREPSIAKYKNSVHQNQIAMIRKAQVNFGFIKPEDISLIDYKFSMTTNKQDEERVMIQSRRFS